MTMIEPVHTFVHGDPKARHQHQIELEKLYSKNQTISRIRQEFEDCKEINFKRYIASQQIPVEFGMDLLIQMALHKRTTLPTLAGILRHHFEPSPVNGPSATQEACNMLQRAAEAGLVDWDSKLKMFIVRFTITEDVQRDLDRFQYPLPMVVPPKRVKDNRDTGYFTSRNSILLKKNHHDDDVCLDHINRVNSIRFAIDYDTARMIANSWRNLDKPKQGETKEDFDKRKRAFNKYDRTAKEVIDKLLAHGNEFYLTHKYDKRGRVYCQGYHVNYQGAPWNKAVIELANREFVD